MPSLPSSSHASLNKLIIGVILYISTGIAQPILIDTLRIHALLGHKYLLLPTLANTTGMALCGLLASTSNWNDFKHLLLTSSSSSNDKKHSSIVGKNNNLKRWILMTALVDLISGMCLTFGILLTGGAIFVILYNSCPAWTALLSKFILGKNLSTIQILGIVLVCVGLVANVLGTKLTTQPNDAVNGRNDKNYGDDENAYIGVIFFGSIIVLVGSLLHSLMFVLSDWTLNSSSSPCHENETSMAMNEKVPKFSIPGEIWSCCLGTIEAIFMFFWVMIGILTTGFHHKGWSPPQNELVNGLSFDGNIYYIIGGFGLLVLVDTIHAASFFTLLKNIGAVASALLKGLQMVIVIALSAIFFCSRESTQCLTTSKVLSALLVLSGVICYGVGSGRQNERKIATTTAIGIVELSSTDNETKLTSRSQDLVEMKQLI